MRPSVDVPSAVPSSSPTTTIGRSSAARKRGMVIAAGSSRQDAGFESRVFLRSRAWLRRGFRARDGDVQVETHTEHADRETDRGGRYGDGAAVEMKFKR